MARLIRRTSETVISRFATGPQVGQIAQQFTRWTVEAVDDAGRSQVLIFDQDAQPTDQDVVDRLPRLVDLTPTAKADFEDALALPYHRWRRWADTLAEATRRAAPAAVITALTAKTDDAWGKYLQAINAWRQAP